MNALHRYSSLARNATAIAAVAVTGVAIVSVLLGGGRASFIDLTFVLAIGCFAIAVILTRPTVARRRSIQQKQTAKEETDDSETDADEDVRLPEYDPEDGYSNPARQLELGITLAIAGGILLCISALVTVMLTII